MNSPKICKKRIGLNGIIIPTQVNISDYLLPGVDQQIQELPPNNYILCIGYTSHGEDDFQIGITGALKSGEDVSDGAKREGREEAGVIINTLSKGFVSQYKKQLTTKKRNITCSLFIVKAEDCDPLTETVNSSKQNDLKSQKITILIHGSLNSILYLINNSPLTSVNSDSISHYVALKVSEAIKICEMLKKEQAPLMSNNINFKKWHLYN